MRLDKAKADPVYGGALTAYLPALVRAYRSGACKYEREGR